MFFFITAPLPTTYSTNPQCKATPTTTATELTKKTGDQSTTIEQLAAFAVDQATFIEQTKTNDQSTSRTSHQIEVFAVSQTTTNEQTTSFATGTIFWLCFMSFHVFCVIFFVRCIDFARGYFTVLKH